MVIVISRPACAGTLLLEKESAIMTALLDQGLERLHVRKPQASFTALSALIGRFSKAHRDKIVLHPPTILFAPGEMNDKLTGLLEFMAEMQLHRLHIPAWLRVSAQAVFPSCFQSLHQMGFVLSTGIHSPVELSALSEKGDLVFRYEYVLVSPLFDSLSKTGYKAKPALWGLPGEKRNRSGGKLIGMGGIQAEHLPTVKNAGFSGAALLGAIWGPLDSPALHGSHSWGQWEERSKKISNYYKTCSDIWKNTKID